MIGLVAALPVSAPAFAEQPNAPAKPAETPVAAPPEAKEPAEPADPEIVKLYLMDGSVITGKLTVKEIELETQFGKLVIPITSVKSFTPGLTHHPELAQKMAGWVEQLGSVQFEQREAAHRELQRMGSAARAELEKRQEDKDTERRTRIKGLLEDIDADDPAGDDDDSLPPPAQRDTVETSEFTAIGSILTKEFTVGSRYGSLSVKLADLQRVQREGGKRPEMRKSFVVDGSHLVQRGLRNSRIRVEKGDKVSIVADGSVVMTPWGNGAVSTPDGGANFGWYVANSIPSGALVASIGPGGKTFKAGSRHTFRADRSGELHFAIAMQNDYINQQFPGKYTVKVRVERK